MYNSRLAPRKISGPCRAELELQASNPRKRKNEKPFERLIRALDRNGVPLAWRGKLKDGEYIITQELLVFDKWRNERDPGNNYMKRVLFGMAAFWDDAKLDEKIKELY